MERYIPVPQTRPKPPRAWLLSLQAGYKRAVLGTTILSNGKEHFGPTDRNDQTGQRGPPSKLVPNIPVGPNRNGPFHLMYQPKLPEFWVEWKAPYESTRRSALDPCAFDSVIQRKKRSGTSGPISPVTVRDTVTPFAFCSRS